MKACILPNGLTRKTTNCLTKAGIPIEKKAITEALKNGMKTFIALIRLQV